MRNSRFVDRDMMMRHHWGLMPGHPYMHQKQTPVAHSGANLTSQERRSGDDHEAQYTDPGGLVGGGDETTYVEELGSDSDSDSDWEMGPDEGSESGEESSSSGGSGQESQGSDVDDDDDEWEVEPMYED